MRQPQNQRLSHLEITFVSEQDLKFILFVADHTPQILIFGSARCCFNNYYGSVQALHPKSKKWERIPHQLQEHVDEEHLEMVVISRNRKMVCEGRKFTWNDILDILKRKVGYEKGITFKCSAEDLFSFQKYIAAQT